MARHIDIASCYATLQVSKVSTKASSLNAEKAREPDRPRVQSATLDDVKSSYKRLALKYHPDKNDSPDATAKFQEIGTAYKAIVDRIEPPTPEPSWYGSNNNNYPYDPYTDHDEGFFMDLEFFLCVAFASFSVDRGRLQI
jgi:hypothetical protein